MIKASFRLGGDYVEVVVRGNELLFSEVGTGAITTIEGLRLSKQGVIKEFPDLKDDEEWKKKAMERLKAHVKELPTENSAMEYVIGELKKFGYIPLTKQRAGFRPQKIE